MSEKFIKVGAAILAAGKASRFQAPKMLLPVFGKPLLQHLLHICDIFVETVVISGFWHTAIAESLSGSQTTLLFNDRYESGIASSLQLAAKYAQQKQWDGLAIVLGDTFVEQRHLEKLLALFKSSLRIVATTKEGILQPPVLFPAAILPLFKNLSGDQGLGAWLRSQQDIQTATSKEAIVDFDSWQDYSSFTDLKNSCFPHST